MSSAGAPSSSGRPGKEKEDGAKEGHRKEGEDGVPEGDMEMDLYGAAAVWVEARTSCPHLPSMPAPDTADLARVPDSPCSSMSSVASAPEVSTTEDNLKRKSGDIGWEYGVLVNPNNLDKVKCILCDKVVSGGIYRIKQHIAHISGNVAKCPKSTKEDQEKCQNSIVEARNKKKSKKAHKDEVRDDVAIRGDGEDDERLEEIGGLAPRKLSPMDKFFNPIDHQCSSLSTQELKWQQKITEAIWKERLHKVKQYVARWFYVSGVPFNAINNDEFKQMMEAVGQFGPRFLGPSQYECREPLLKEEVARISCLLKAHEEKRVMTGCSIMTDAWTDQRRSIMNLCVHCSLGTCFLESVEASEDAHTSEYILEYVDACIEKIGPQNVVQVVTNNAFNNIRAKELLKAKRPTIFWSSCARHAINLMLQGIGTMAKYKKTLDQAKSLTVFIYSHHKTLALMRRHTKRRDIIRPGVTRFASAFLTLQSLIEKKVELRAMALSKEWKESAHTKNGKGIVATGTLISRSFWNGVSNMLKVFEPLVKILRMVNGDGPSMAFLYGEILEAKKQIKESLNNAESNYKLIIETIDTKMKGRLDSPLYITAYLLNPYYSYRDRSIFLKQTIMDGFIECVEIFYHGDEEAMDQVLNVDFDIFKEKKETFGKTSARLGCQKFDFVPANWWFKYGCHVPCLQRMAIRILSLTSSSSGCERNWSTFDMIHTKKRSKLDAHCINNLIYVQFNGRLMNKKEKCKSKNIDVLLASHATFAQGWVIEDEDEEVDPETGLL